METHRLDFHRTFRLLSFFRPPASDNDNARFIQQLLDNVSPTDRQMVNTDSARKEWEEWLERFKGRIQEDQMFCKDDAGNVSSAVSLDDLYELRVKEAKKTNPRFVLRQWVLEEIIKRVESDPEKGKRQLAKVMHVSSFSFHQRNLCKANIYFTDGM